MEFTIEPPSFDRAAICVPILRALKDWFGIEEAVLRYATEIDSLPTLVAYGAVGEPLGFLSLKLHNPFSAELYVLGIRPEARRQGIGRALVGKAEAWLKEQGVEYLQVKTLGPSNPDENYAQTRAFYLSVGFRPLEEFTRIWDEQNPCLILIKKL